MNKKEFNNLDFKVNFRISKETYIKFKKKCIKKQQRPSLRIRTLIEADINSEVFKEC